MVPQDWLGQDYYNVSPLDDPEGPGILAPACSATSKGIHKLSTVFKALRLGHPSSVEACSTVTDGDIYPAGVTARFEFPARADMPPVRT